MKTPFFSTGSIIGATGLAVIGCVSQLTTAGAQVADSDGRGLESCRFLGDLAGSSLLHGFRVQEGIQSAKNDVRNEAADMGATIVVWGQISQGENNTSITGKAYRCSSGPAQAQAPAPQPAPPTTGSPAPPSSSMQ